VYRDKNAPAFAGWLRGKDLNVSRLAYHNDVEFQFIKRGTGAYFIGGKNYPFRKNSLLIVRSREIHSFIPQADCFIEKGSLIFSGAYLNKLQKAMMLGPDFPRHLRLSEGEAASIEFILNQIQREFDAQKAHWREMVRLKLKEFLCLLKRICLRPELAPVENPVVSQLTAYLEKNFSQPVKIFKLAREYGFSQSHLTRLFSRYTGLGLKRYLMQRRIIEGKQLIENRPELKLAAIAGLVGFNEFADFNRAFRIFTGLTPSAYRKIARQGTRR
jgi:AraC family transcriptional regulator, arabinose operon regulatory protein